MIEVKKNDFMRAVYYHNLDVKYSCKISNGIVRGEWRLGYNVVCKQTSSTSLENRVHKETLVDESFKAKYIDTTPEEVWHCRTCCRRSDCSFVREDLDRFCNKWVLKE